MKITAEPRSDQWNADDLVSGPRTFVVAGVKEGTAEQKYDIQLEGSERVWRPPLTVLRILLVAWGDEAKEWVGRRVVLYRDESIRFGPNEVGGIRVSHLSHIDKPMRIALSDKRGSRKAHTVQPLVAAAPTRPAPTVDPILVSEWCETFNAAETVAQLQAAWEGAQRAGVTGHPDVVAAKEKRKGEL